MVGQFEPDKQLEKWVDYIWYVSEGEIPQARRKDTIMPLGHMNVIFNFLDGYTMLEKGVQRSLPDVAVVGQIKTAKTVYYGKSVLQIGIALKPTAFMLLFRKNSEDFTECIEEGPEMLMDLHETLKRIETVEQKVERIWKFLKERRAVYYRDDQLMEQMMTYIESSVDNFNVSVMAEHFYMSVSTLERYFKRTIGLTPKAYANIKRFVINQRSECDKVLYYDQSHLIKASKLYTGKTPKALTYEQDEITLDFIFNQKSDKNRSV